MHAEVSYWMERLRLEPHPEGGYFKEIYRSGEISKFQSFTGKRNVSTAIYYLLTEGSFSAFHRIRSDECWHFYSGDPVEIYMLSTEGGLSVKVIGNHIDKDDEPFTLVPKLCWFAARSLGNYSLVGCTVAPGFDFKDFEMAQRDNLLNQYPQHQMIIKSFTRF